ncbi:hypothetical protein HOLleu_38090 [Holothuria leucospilota]|uniref:Tyrosine-protein kinase ephrin type A/B receptor-like domain-containing protein n=1 Tax=Holothuria leucospilota TaxID=206669 RepID=A0A9Q0YPU4_HOLLE|nr:hypothetical protein HOLleu_38090 [Holothuria leucospilota]
MGGIGCKTCNNGTFIKEGSGRSALSCKVCPGGTDHTRPAGFRACFCLENFYRTDRFDQCFPCPNNGLQCSNDHVRIKQHYYWYWESNLKSAYQHFIVNILIRNDSYDRQWSMFQGPLPKAYKCPVEENCVNDNSEVEGNCREGYRGWMCTICDDDYFELFGWCQKCHPFLAVGIIILLLLLVSFLWFVIIQPVSAPRTTRGKFISDMIISRFKIMFGFYQVVESYWFHMGTHVRFAPIQLAISRIVGVMSFTLSSILVSPKCYISWFQWNPYTELWTVYLTLALFTCIVVLTYSVVRGAIRREWIGWSVDSVRTACLKLFVFTLFASYTEICDVVFKLYNCDEFSLYEYQEIPKVRFLHSHYNISCDDAIYKRYRRFYAVPGWIFLCSFPMIMWTCLYKCSRFQRDCNVTVDRYYPEWLRFMCENYKPQCWYWEIVELGRKILLTFLPLAFGWKGIFVLAGLFASGLFLALHAYVRPMKHSWDNTLQVSLETETFKQSFTLLM